MDYYYDPRTIFHLVEGGFRPSISPKFTIQFHFSIQTKYNNYYLNHDSSLRGFVQHFPTSAASVSASIPVRDFLTFEEVEAALGGTIGGRIPAAQEHLISRAWEHVCESLSVERLETIPRNCDLHLAFHVRVEHRHVYVVEGESPFAIPAAEKYRVGDEDDDEDEEWYCCICLEELGGGGGRRGGALRMPCSHVFHGGCIRKWLRKSPCCPLCRYEMPMEENRERDSSLIHI